MPLTMLGIKAPKQPHSAYETWLDGLLLVGCAEVLQSDFTHCLQFSSMVH